MTPTQTLAAQLIAAHRTHRLIDAGSIAALTPADAEEAYVVQQSVLAELGGCAGYKIGAASPTAEPSYAPLPARRVFGAAKGVRLADYTRLGLELEIAFSFAEDIDRTFAERAEDTLDAIDTMSVVVEVVDSRYEGWPKIDPLLQLADLQNNGALVIGESRPTTRISISLRRRSRFAAGSTRFSAVARSIPRAIRAASLHGSSRRRCETVIRFPRVPC